MICAPCSTSWPAPASLWEPEAFAARAAALDRLELVTLGLRMPSPARRAAPAPAARPTVPAGEPISGDVATLLHQAAATSATAGGSQPGAGAKSCAPRSAVAPAGAARPGARSNGSAGAGTLSSHGRRASMTCSTAW